MRHICQNPIHFIGKGAWIEQLCNVNSTCVSIGIPVHLIIIIAKFFTLLPLIIQRVFKDKVGVSSDMSMYGRLFFSESDKEDKDLGIITLLTELGFLKEVSGKSGYYYLTAKAWERIEEIGHDTNNSRQAFIAMQFGNDTDSVYRTIKESIIESGFEPLRIDEKEHNKQIVPEILYEINRSKFVVFDLTTPNYGAYYEAGYALGRGIEVIARCRKKSFENDKTRPHFDLVQKSIVIYDGDDDLKERLIRRITATVR